MARIGAFVCWCGRNIAGTVDVKAVSAALRRHPGVVHAEDYTYLCSDPGQSKVREAVRDKKLGGVVVAACSPQLHESTFRGACAKAGLNPYLCEMANIREHCSWVHDEPGPATAKAIELAKAAVEKVRRARPLRPIRIPVTRRALVVGGGVAGIQTALGIAGTGHEVLLLERQPFVGGQMARLASTFPRLESARELLRPLLVRLLGHPRIRVLTSGELVELSGYVGNFVAKIRRRPSAEMPDGDDWRHELCPPQAAAPTPEEEIVEVEVGAVVAATGFDLYPLSAIGEYGGGRHADVMTSLDFERLLIRSEGGSLGRPSDGKVPREVVFVQCVRSRDRERGKPYCSRICCAYTAKQATLYKQRVPDGQAWVFYLDLRVQGKEDEEFVRRAVEDHGVMYLRGRVSRLFPRDDKLVVWGADTLSGKNVEIEADAVVLAAAMVPQGDASELARRLGISTDAHGFFSEAHPKLRPVETNTAGVYLAGTCQAPRGIAGTVAHASAAASKVIELFSSEQVERAPEIARVDATGCVGCFACREVCPYRAIEEEELRDRAGRSARKVAAVNEGLCQGCGLCVATCRSGMVDLDGYTDEQIFWQIAAFGRGSGEEGDR